MRRSTRFVTWVRSWRAGLSPYDEVAGEIAGDEEHLVADAPDTWTDVPLASVLSAFAKLSPDEIRLVLPVAGDPRGLPGPGPFTGAALLAEEGVIAGRFGLVPEVQRHTSGSGDTFETVLWQMHPLAEAPARGYEPGPAEAEADLTNAIVEATGQLTRLDIAQWRPELAGALATLRRPDFAGDLPPGYDARSRRLYARASVLDQVLTLAGQAAPGGAVTGYEANRRDEALRPLRTACRHALVAACNARLAP
ncbi:hypothetical protein Raf01_65260 [Rugosimonospora africana]|uniref:Uncharacterized protein n=1 Tax=Rugosimonospora africana TaxID=556532 RepID=A0A8J3VTS4_9ACTN|nr:hypothetical protein Raf01_65260 [Rugosimonospora africana]